MCKVRSTKFQVTRYSCVFPSAVGPIKTNFPIFFFFFERVSPFPERARLFIRACARNQTHATGYFLSTEAEKNPKVYGIVSFRREIGSADDFPRCFFMRFIGSWRLAFLQYIQRLKFILHTFDYVTTFPNSARSIITFRNFDLHKVKGTFGVTERPETFFITKICKLNIHIWYLDK